MAFHLTIKKPDFNLFKIRKEANFHRMFIEKDTFDRICRQCSIDVSLLYNKRIDLEIHNKETGNTVKFLHKTILSSEIEETYKKDHNAKLVMSTGDSKIDLVVV